MGMCMCVCVCVSKEESRLAGVVEEKGKGERGHLLFQTPEGGVVAGATETWGGEVEVGLVGLVRLVGVQGEGLVASPYVCLGWGVACLVCCWCCLWLHFASFS